MLFMNAFMLHHDTKSSTLLTDERGKQKELMVK